MEVRLARIISFLLHPVFLPFYMLLFLFSMNFHAALVLTPKAKLFLAIVVMLTTILIPLLLNLIFLRMKLIQSLRMETREERIFPLITQVIFFYLTYYLLKQYQVPFIFTFYMLGATFLVFCTMVITLFYKISLHMTGMGGVFGFFLGLALKYSLPMADILMIIILISGITGVARLKENSHKNSEIYAGFLAGTVLMMALFLLL